MSDVNHQAIPRNTLLKYALAYAERGIRVFATTADGKAPSISNAAWSQYLGREIRKGQGGLHMASTDPENIRWQFTQWGAGGIGMPTGKVNGVIVADFDIHKEKGTGNAHRQMMEYADEISETHQVITRNGGVHAYFAYEPGHSKHELGENIDIQTDGAYVLLPPSKGYKVKFRVDREDWSPPPWKPVPVVRQTREQIENLEAPDLVKMQGDMVEGSWHNNMVRLVAHMVMTGWSDAEILRHARQWTLQGHSHDDTFEEVYTALQGARVKWINDGRPPSPKERKERWMADFRSFDQETARQALEWAQKLMKEEASE